MERKEKLPSVSYEDIKWRLNRPYFPPRRIKAGIETVDRFFGGGLPQGVIIFLGGAGTGKSLLARTIAQEGSWNRVLYITSEVRSDAPDKEEYPHVDSLDYTVYQPRWDRAIAELKKFVEVLEPDLVVIDSLTSFLSVSKKALAESDVREGVGIIHQEFDGTIPIIGISEVRGSGFTEGPAGGRGVEHACSTLVYFEHLFVKTKSQEGVYGEIGEDVYLVRPLKDKANAMGHSEMKIRYDSDGIPHFYSVRRNIDDRGRRSSDNDEERRRGDRGEGERRKEKRKGKGKGPQVR